MIQGEHGAFGVRIPVAYMKGRTAGPTLFRIGLATPLLEKGIQEQAVSLSEMSLLFTSFRTAFQCSVL